MVFLGEILPVGDAFREGLLAMPGASPEGVGAVGGWLSCEVNAALVSLVVILFLIGLSDLYHLLPSLDGCLIRWRANVTLEHSVQLSRDRSTAAAVCLLGVCLILDRIGFCAPSFVSDAAPGWHVPLRVAVAAGYLLLRRIIFSLMRFGRMPSDARKASHMSLFNIFIPVSLILFLITGLMLVFGASDASLRGVTTVLCCVGFALAIVRKFQILNGYCSFLTSFSYLCALEFVPAAGLIVCSSVL